MTQVRSRWLGAVGAMTMLWFAAPAPGQQLKLLPGDTEMVVTVNWQQILKSDIATSNRALLDLGKAWVRDQLEEKGADKYLKQANFDIFRDLDVITVGVPANRPPQQGFVILEGRFEPAKFDAAATDAGNDNGGVLKVIKIAGVTAYEITVDDDTAYVGILGKKTMIAASAKEDFVSAVKAFNGESPNRLKRDVRSLQDMSSTRPSISIVATAGLLNKLAENAPRPGGNQVKAAEEVMKQINGVNIGINIQRDIDLHVGIAAKDDKTASGFKDMSNLFITGARAKVNQQAKDNEKFVPAAEVLNSLRATTQGANFILRAQIGAETLGKLLQNLPFGNN